MFDKPLHLTIHYYQAYEDLIINGDQPVHVRKSKTRQPGEIVEFHPQKYDCRRIEALEKIEDSITNLVEKQPKDIQREGATINIFYTTHGNIYYKK